MAGLSILRRLLMKQAMKESAPFQDKGIMSISKSLSGNVDAKIKRWAESAKRQGQDLDKMSEQELKYLIELNKPKAPTVLSNEDAYAFLNQFLKQGKKDKGKVIEFPRDKITDWTKARPQPPETEIIDGIQTTKGLGDLFPKQLEKTVTVRTVIEDIKKLKPIDSMKETNRVLRGEGQYKNLSKADREKIAGDESVTDHIFERNIKYDADGEEIIDWDVVDDIDPEDFAGGGIAGMLGEPTYQDEEHRVPYKDAKLVEGENYMPPKNFYGVGLGPILDEFMSEGRPRDEEGFHTTLNKNDLINLWNYLKEDQDIDIEDELMFRFGRFNPDKNSMLHIGIGKDKKEIGFKKKFNEGGRVPYSKGSSPEVLPADFDELDHDELMHIIKLLQAGEIPKLADGGRIGFGAGGIDKMRRLFLQATGAGAAGVGAAKSGLFGLLKSSKSAVVKDLTQVPIHNAEGMPSWFKPLVNRVIKEGTDITKLPPNKGGAYLDRQIVHSAKLGEGQGVKVYQNLDDQTIRVEYHSADNMGGVDDGIVHLEYKAAEEIPMDNEVFKNLPKGKSSVKTKPTFEANEAYPLQDSKDYKTITFEGDNTVKNVDDLFSDTSALKQFATGKNLSKKELAIAKQKQKQVKKIHDNPSEELAGSGPDYDDYDFASGGRVPFKGGKKVLEGLAKLFDEFFPGTTKIGKTSRPMAEKTQLRRAITDFKNREKHKTLLDDFNKKYTVKDEIKISSEQVGSLDEFHADFVKETGINIPKENLKHAWDIKKSYPFNTPIVDKNGKFIGQEATQVMYPKSKKFIISDEDKLTKEINLKREGKLPSGERAGIDVPPVPESFKLSREKLIENFPEIGLDEIDEIMKLDKETQARMIMMLKNRRLDPDLYDELLLKHGDTLDFQGEFDKAIRRKKNATGGRVSLSSGGVAGMLGE